MVMLMDTPFITYDNEFGKQFDVNHGRYSFNYNIYNQQKRRPNGVLCANCGAFGHVYKTCNHPVISYGVICFQLFYDEKTNSVYPRYLMVQRKDSLSYVEFIRGKFDIKNKKYIMRLLSSMTPDERQKIADNDFDTLWKDMWCKHEQQESNKNFNKEFNEASEKINILKKGYVLQTEEGEEITFSLEKALTETVAEYTESEWGFPKGRRNINEDDVSCAVREFREETGISPKNIRLCQDIKPLEEIFTGTNKIRYKHVYYIAKYINTPDLPKLFDPYNKQQCKEIKDVRWFSYQDAQNKIRKQNVERKEMFKRINHIIVKNMV
jgi:8-oxo-dGTP pyrophosphatase MutT (NUDIX family)